MMRNMMRKLSRYLDVRCYGLFAEISSCKKKKKRISRGECGSEMIGGEFPQSELLDT